MYLQIFEIIHLVRTQNFPETNMSHPLIRIRTCAYHFSF